MRNIYGLDDGGSGRCPVCGMSNWFCALTFVITPVVAAIGILLILYLEIKRR